MLRGLDHGRRGHSTDSSLIAGEVLYLEALTGFPLALDVRMPGMMGPELCDVMAARTIVLPVIFLTGHAYIPGDVDACYEGAALFVKPVDAEVLLQAIRLALACPC